MQQTKVNTISRQKSRHVVEKMTRRLHKQKKKFTKNRQKKGDELLRQVDKK